MRCSVLHIPIYIIEGVESLPPGISAGTQASSEGGRIVNKEVSGV